MILKLIWECKKPKLVKTALKIAKVIELTQIDFNYYSKTTVIKTACYWCKGRQYINRTS